MAAFLQDGIRNWDLSIDDSGHRTYNVVYLVTTDDPDDGPLTVSQCSGLPACGDSFSEGNDTDPNVYAGCGKTVRRHPQIKEGNPGKVWEVVVQFTSKPKNRCCENEFENPVDEPDQISIQSETFTYEAVYDRDANEIKYSSHERIHGPENEWEDVRIKVTITQNVSDAELPLLASMVNTVNDAELWGMDARTIRFASFSVQEKYHGLCEKYFVRSLVFDVRYDGQDRRVSDRGNLALNGHWGTNSGTGCTVTITTSGGSIVTAVLGAGGSGYPRSASITLGIDGGTGGQVTAQTNATGVVTSVTLSNEGSGYSNGTAATTGGSGWVLDLVDDPCGSGSPVSPDANNPSHFQRYLDRTGNPATCVFAESPAGHPYDPCLSDDVDSWWCINDGYVPYTFQGTCSNATLEAIIYNAYILGPYDTEAEALNNCAPDDYAVSLDPETVVCTDSRANEIYIEVYQEGDLLLLGIPSEIGVP